MPTPKYHLKSGKFIRGNETKEFGLVDPVGRILHISYSDHDLNTKRDQYQDAFDLGWAMCLNWLEQQQ